MIKDFINLDAIRKYVRNYRFGIWLLEGRECSGGEELKIIYAGNAAGKNYISNLAFDNHCKETYCGIVWLWPALKLQHKYPDYHIVILDISDNLYRRYSARLGVYIPCWVDGELDFAEAKKRYQTSESIKSDLRKIKKNQMEYEVTRDRKLFDHFYYEMYVPHIKRVHEDRALLMSHRVMVHKMPQCELLLIKMNGEYVAGEVMIYENGTVRAWSLGAKQGDMNYLKAGAVAAIYYFRSIYLENKGHKSVRMGASRAFLKDGVIQYKKKWGMRLIKTRPAGFAIRPVSMTKGVMGFLAHNPFIFEHQGKLEGALFLNKEPDISEDQIKKLYKDYYIEGLSRMNFYLVMDKKTDIKIPFELSDKIVIKPPGSLFNIEAS